MKVVRDDAARWLPSRHRFALMRLIGFFVSRSRRPSRQHHVMLVIDRDQSTVEAYGLSIIYLSLTACYLAAWSPAAALLAPLVIEIPMYTVGLLLPRGRDNLNVHSAVLMALMFAVSAWLSTHPSWVRFPASAFLALCAMNAIAAVIMFPLDRRCAA